MDLILKYGFPIPESNRWSVGEYGSWADDSHTPGTDKEPNWLPAPNGNLAERSLAGERQGSSNFQIAQDLPCSGRTRMRRRRQIDKHKRRLKNIKSKKSRSLLPSFFAPEPVPQSFAGVFSNMGFLNKLSKCGQRAVVNFLYWIQTHRLYAEAQVPSRLRPSPALGQKLKWAAKNIMEIIDIARSQKLWHIKLLSRAESNILQFIAKQPKVRVIPLTPVNYLRYYAWFAQTPAVSYGLFVLLQRHSRPRLTRHATLQLIGRIQSEIFGHHVQIEAIDKQISRFSVNSSFRLRRLLREIDRLPELTSDKM
jgi:hypothetical protein